MRERADFSHPYFCHVMPLAIPTNNFIMKQLVNLCVLSPVNALSCGFIWRSLCFCNLLPPPALYPYVLISSFKVHFPLSLSLYRSINIPKFYHSIQLRFQILRMFSLRAQVFLFHRKMTCNYLNRTINLLY